MRSKGIPREQPFHGAIKVIWSEPTEQVHHTYADLTFAVERGACAVAISFIESEMSLTVSARSRRRTGFDYWVSKRNPS